MSDDDGQVLRDAALVLSARRRFDQLAAAIRADLCDDRAVAELHHWLADVQPRVVDALRRLADGPDPVPVRRLARAPGTEDLDGEPGRDRRRGSAPF